MHKLDISNIFAFIPLSGTKPIRISIFIRNTGQNDTIIIFLSENIDNRNSDQ